jgi:predicted ATPase/DNA-binding SARP family transcriptional activator
MDFRILGPLEVSADGRAVPLAGAKPRAVLAMLLLHLNEPVSAERLAAALWGEDAPAGAVKTVQVHVSRLRKALGDPDLLATTPAGYQLNVHPEQIDAACFERQVAAGRRALAAGHAGRASDLLRAALALWRGAPLAEFAWAPFAPTEINRLEELHLAAIEVRVEIDLAARREAELIAELQQLTSRHPWRERLHAQLMLALYRSGRQADALGAYRHAREVLVDRLGIEPGPELQELNQAILVHDPALQPPRATVASVSDRRRALPAPPNRTIGRDDEVVIVGERLRADSVRLLTLTGPGGVGKTRLALESARAVNADFADGAQFVSLASLSRPEDVPAAIVTTLGIIVLSGESAAGAVERFLAAKHLLLVVDNFEHVLAAAPFIARLLAACPELTVLATSREPLALAAEERYVVSPLALPDCAALDDPETLVGVDALALFCERARARDSGFGLGGGNAAVVAEICRRLDGLPLAIELAAARCGLLSAREIGERLDASLAALAVAPRDAPARQQTLRATIDWSYELLGDAEKACFARFAVFAGGATVEAAEAITGAELDTLDRLVAKSLIVRDQPTHSATRLRMLETIRAYAGERFAAAAESESVDERHYRYYRALAQHHGTEQALCGSDRERHLAKIDADIDNINAALAWAVQQGEAEYSLAMVVALGRYWLMRNRYADGEHWIEQALNTPSTHDQPELRVRALCAKIQVLWPLGRGSEQATILDEAEAIARALADPVIISQVLQIRARHAQDTQPAAAHAFADEAVRWAEISGDSWEIANACDEKSLHASTITQLRESVDRAASLLDEAGNTYRLAALLAGAPYGAVLMGSDVDAMELVERAIPTVREHGTPFLWTLLCGNLGLAALMTGDTERATRAFCEELALCRELLILPLASEGLRGLAALAALRCDDARAARLAGAAAAHRYGEPEVAVDRRLTATFFEPSRTRLGADRWDAAAREGALLSFQDAIIDSLQEQHAHREVVHGTARVG